VTATAPGGALPSQRLKLTVLPPAPLASVTSVTKTTSPQTSVAFTLTNTPSFPNNSSWKVYSAATGGTAVTDITAANSGATLTLTKSAGFTPGTYYIAAHDTTSALESAARLQLTVITAATPKPVDIAGSKAKDTLTQSTVVFTSGTHPSTDWKVYSAETGGSPLGPQITASYANSTVSLTQSGDLPAGDYWVSAKESGQTESARVKLTVLIPRTLTPVVGGVTSKPKTNNPETSLTFSPLTPVYAAAATMKVYTTAAGDILSQVVTAQLGWTTVTHEVQLLSLRATTDIPTASYWVSVQEPGKSESARVQVTVGGYTQTSTPSLVQSTATKVNAKTFTVSISKSYPAGTSFRIRNYVQTPATAASWDSASGMVVGVTGTVLTLKTSTYTGGMHKVGDNPLYLPNGIYYVTAQEPGKGESGTVAINVGGGTAK
jgi:hypothetical protein